MTVVQIWLWASTVAATVISLGFLTRLMSLRWERTPTGRALMLLSAAIAVLAIAAMMRRLGVEAWLAPIAAVGWSLLAVATAWRWALMERSQRRG